MLKRTSIGAIALAFLAMQVLMFSFVAMPHQGLAIAQDQGGGNQGGGGTAIDVDVTETTEPAVWYGQWWVWAIGVAVFLIVIIALTNRGGHSA